jgi:hypothetical protein
MSVETILVTVPVASAVANISPSPINVSIAQAGVTGPAGQDGGGLTAGPGLQIVGAELRYNLSALTRG